MTDVSGIHEWWNERVSTIITPDIDSQIAAGVTEELAVFKWSQLVWQEILMFANLGVVEPGDIDWLVRRRGFNAVQHQFLLDAITFLEIPIHD